MTIAQLTSRVGSGVTPTGGSDVYLDAGVVFIRSQNVTNGGLDLRDVAFVDEKTHERMAASAVLPFDVLLNITGASIGRCCHVPEDVGAANSNQHVCTIRLLNGDLRDAGYLVAVLRSAIGQRQIWRLNAGGNREGLNYQQIRSFVVPWPDKHLRRRIAEILSTVDEAIEQTEALIAKYQQIKAGLMHDLFTRGLTPQGKLRPTPSEAPNLYKPSPLGMIPSEWDVLPLAQILRDAGGYLQTGPFGSQLHAHEYVREGIPVVMPQDIEDGRIDSAQIARIAPQRALDLSKHRMRGGDIVIARRGDLSRASVIDLDTEGWLCGTGCFLLRLGGSAYKAEFAAYCYRHPLIQRQLAGLAVGTTMPSLNNSIMERLLFVSCATSEQTDIVEVLASIESSVRSLETDLAKLGTKKLGLMQDLLTGRVRVPIPDAEEPAA